MPPPRKGIIPGGRWRRLKMKSGWRIVLKNLIGQVIIILIINAIIPLARLSILCLDLPGLSKSWKTARRISWKEWKPGRLAVLPRGTELCKSPGVQELGWSSLPPVSFGQESCWKEQVLSGWAVCGCDYAWPALWVTCSLASRCSFSHCFPYRFCFSSASKAL